MKESKLKKGLKIASVCGLAGVALLGFAGCATINDKEKDNLLSSIEKIDDIQTTLDDINAEIDSVNYLAMKEKAWDIASGAIRKFKNSESDIYDNLIMKYFDSGEEDTSLVIFKDENNEQVSVYSVEEETRWEYIDNDKHYSYCEYISQSGNGYYKKQNPEEISNVVFQCESFWNWFDLWFTKDNVTNIEIKENGNKVINFVNDDIEIIYDQLEPDIVVDRKEEIYKLKMEVDTLGRIVKADITVSEILLYTETIDIDNFSMEYRYVIENFEELKNEFERIKGLENKEDTRQ